MATEDLKDEILELKKRLHTVSSENYILKVKVRKLHNELFKKDKQIESILDPTKTSCIRKIISERGATMIINLKQRVNELEELLLEKNNIIKKLHYDIQTSKVYLSKESSSSSIKISENKHISLEQKECTYRSSKKNLRSRSLTVTPIPRQTYVKSASDIQMEYVRLAQNLQKIKLANASKQRPTSHNLVEKTKNTVENKLAKSAVIEGNKSTFNNNRQVEDFSTLLEEMEKLKKTVTNLSAEQESTKKNLRDKNKNIEILARKVKNLQKNKFIKTSCKSQSNTILKPLEKISSEEQELNSSSYSSYTKDSFEDEYSIENDSKKFSQANNNGLKENTASPISENIEISDDDDVETGESK